MKVFMIAVIGSQNKDVLGYRLLDLETGEIKDVPANALINAMSSGSIQVENLDVVFDELVGTNGSIDRYPYLINGIPYGKSPLIILKEMNNGDYTVCDFKGEIVRMRKLDVINYGEVEGIANGKIVNREGGKFVSAISGEYEKEPPVDIEKSKEKIENKLNILGVDDYRFNTNNEFYIVNKKLESVKVPDGVVKIAPSAFAHMPNLKMVRLPNSVERLGVKAFYGCNKLEKVSLSNKIDVIPKECFAQCKSLSEIEIPASVKKIEQRAFFQCSKLRKIILKNSQTHTEFGAIPVNCKKIFG